MALSASTVWEVRASGASDNSGGGFVAGSGGTDFSQQNAAQVAVGGGVVTSSITTTVVTFTGSTYTVLAGDVGNIVQFISGTNVTAGFYQITAVSAGLNGTWTLDRTPLTSGTTTNAVANMGGALATLGKLAGAMIASNDAHATGAFSSTATTTFAQTVTPAPATPYTRLRGYGSVRGDGGHATLTLSTNTGLTGINITGAGWRIENIDVDCASLGTSTGISSSQTNTYVANCKASNFTVMGIGMLNTNSQILRCEATGGTAAASQAMSLNSSGGYLRQCFVHDNACPAVISASAGVRIVENLIVNNSGASSDGVRLGFGGYVEGNTIHNNGRHGVFMNGLWLSTLYIRNNILSNNGGYGLQMSNGAAVPAAFEYDGNAYYSNTSGSRNLADSVAGIFGVTPYGTVATITNITQAASAVVTVSAPHTLQIGEAVSFAGVVGMTQINALTGIISAITSTTLTVNINSSGFTAYGSGGSLYFNPLDKYLTASPYVGGTTGTASNFALNNTAGGGAVCRAAGFPANWPGNSGTTGYPDLGAAQHQDSAAGGPVASGRLSGGLQ